MQSNNNISLNSSVNLSLKEKIGQLFMIGFKGTDVPDEARKFIETNSIGAVILFARNIDTVSQVKRLTQQIHSSVAIPPFIFTDQEGGTVVQFKEIAATVISAMGLAATGNPGNARTAGRIIGQEMKSVGIDGVLAPVLDVNFEENNPIIGIRSFSDDPQIVIDYAAEFAAGLNEGGVASCGKHFPGHGGTTTDSHQEIPEVHVSPEYFQHYCFNPFAALAQQGIDAIMSSHVRFPLFSPSIASFCPLLIGRMLRRDCRFNGLVISDCMEMRAVKDHFTPEEIVLNAISAGIDLIIASHSPVFQKELLDALHFYVKKGTISEKRIDESVTRLLKLKQKYNLIQPPATPKASITKNFAIDTAGDKISESSNRVDEGIDEENVEGNKALELEDNTGKDPDLLRTHINTEKNIAGQSITLLRNRLGLVPFNPENRILIIEWTKIKATMSISQAESISMMATYAKKYIENVDVIILDPGHDISEELKTQIKAADTVIAGLYTRMPEIGQVQADSLKEIIKIRNDVIVVALGNPYDICFIPNIDTYVVTYGFRRVQVEALFEVLTGKIEPNGKLPVHMKKLFPRGFSFASHKGVANE